MAEESRKIEIRSGGVRILTALEGLMNGSVGKNILTSLSGWEEPSASITTVPKLFGAGSWVKSKRIEEKEITLEIDLGSDYPKETQRNLSAIIEQMEIATISRITYEGEIELRKEVLEGYFTGMPSYREISSHASLSLVFRATNPLKSIYVNGLLISSTTL